MRIQFNVKSGKDFRVAMAKANDAMHKLNDYKCSRQDRVNSLNKLISTNNADIDKIKNGELGVIRALEDIESENKEYAAKLDIEKKNLMDATEAQKKACEKAFNMVPKTLWEAAKSGDESEFNKAFAQWLVANGFDTATEDNVPVLHFGMKKSSAKNACKSGKLTDFMGYNTWRELFIRVLSDELCEQKVIDPYKYGYKIPEKQAK